MSAPSATIICSWVTVESMSGMEKVGLGDFAKAPARPPIATFSTQVFGGPQGYDYRETLSPWLRHLLIFNIHPEWMADVPWHNRGRFRTGLLCLFSCNPAA